MNHKVLTKILKQELPIEDNIVLANQRKDDYFENYEQICSDDLDHEKTPSIVKQKLSEFVTKNIGDLDNKIIADFGSADCFIISNLDKKDTSTVVAVDIAKEYLKKCIKADIKINADLEDLPLNDASIDLAISTDVLEHVMDDDRVITNITNSLKKGAIFFLATPWEQDLSVYELPEYKVKYAKYKYVHLRSINDNYMNKKIFPYFELLKDYLITDGMELMEFKPYAIKIHMLKKK